MATLREIKRRISGVKNTRKITQAMRMVAAAKLKRAQSMIESARPYANKLREILIRLVESVGDDYSHELIKKHGDTKNVLLVVVSSDRGLCGSFNSNLFKRVKYYLENQAGKDYPDANFHIIPVGKKSVSFFRKQNYNVVKEYSDIFTALNFTTAREIVDYISYNFVQENFDKVIVYFNEFKNVLTQVPTDIALLPIEAEIVAGEEAAPAQNVDYIYEPGQKEILDDLLPKHLMTQFWRILLESNSAEQASRMVAMETATNNAKDIISNLELLYNKKRQEAITTEMMDIVGGAEALSGH